MKAAQVLQLGPPSVITNVALPRVVQTWNNSGAKYLQPQGRDCKVASAGFCRLATQCFSQEDLLPRRVGR